MGGICMRMALAQSLRTYLKVTKANRAGGGVSQVIEHPSTKDKAQDHKKTPKNSKFWGRGTI
jgi:hypothetical protein